MIIPWQQLENDTLHNLIKEFILREGTDYGEYEITLEQKVTQVLRQLQAEEVVIVFSELHQSVDIKPKNYIN